MSGGECWPPCSSFLFQETKIAVGGQCCRCARELRCGPVRAARSMTSPVYWVTTIPRCGKSHILRVCFIFFSIRVTPVTYTPVPRTWSEHACCLMQTLYRSFKPWSCHLELTHGLYMTLTNQPNFIRNSTFKTNQMLIKVHYKWLAKP